MRTHSSAPASISRPECGDPARAAVAHQRHAAGLAAEVIGVVVGAFRHEAGAVELPELAVVAIDREAQLVGVVLPVPLVAGMDLDPVAQAAAVLEALGRARPSQGYPSWSLLLRLHWSARPLQRGLNQRRVAARGEAGADLLEVGLIAFNAEGIDEAVDVVEQRDDVDRVLDRLLRQPASRSVSISPCPIASGDWVSLLAKRRIGRSRSPMATASGPASIASMVRRSTSRAAKVHLWAPRQNPQPFTLRRGRRSSPARPWSRPRGRP